MLKKDSTTSRVREASEVSWLSDPDHMRRLVDCPDDKCTIDAEMSGSKARHSTLKACATSQGSESLV